MGLALANHLKGRAHYSSPVAHDVHEPGIGENCLNERETKAVAWRFLRESFLSRLD
jgi:hypothetical protein